MLVFVVLAWDRQRRGSNKRLPRFIVHLVIFTRPPLAL